MSNLDPAFTIGSQLTEPIRICLGLGKAEAKDGRSTCWPGSASRTRSGSSRRTRTRSPAAWRNAC